jgi:2-oxoglutarate ferredoxin oxidoreductase subunit alpha
VFVLSDLDIGMNDWMVPRLRWDDGYRPDRGKVLSAEQLEKMQAFYRYLDVDGDGVTARTLPGVHPKGAYFTRGSGHNKYGAYTEDSGEYVEVMDRVDRKIRSAAHAVPEPIVQKRAAARYGVVTVGSPDRAVREALDHMAAEGLPLDFMRIRGFPFNGAVSEFLAAHELTFVVEQNRDAQLRSLLTLETPVPKEKLRSVTNYGGLPLSWQHVADGISDALQGRDA